MEEMDPLTLLITGIFIAVSVYVAHLAAKRRREGLTRVAKLLGLTFKRARNRKLVNEFQFFPDLYQGRDRYADNVLSGEIDGCPVRIFDFHYIIGYGKSKQRYKETVFLCLMPREFPDLSIAPEGFFDKVAQTLGSDDIDFESHKFSEQYKVHSPDKKFAYDFCNARMIEYLLDIPTVRLELRQHAIKLSYTGTGLTSDLVKPKFIDAHVRKMLKIRSLVPDYLFKEKQI